MRPHWLIAAYLLGAATVWSSDPYERHFRPEDYRERQIRLAEEDLLEATEDVRWWEKEIKREGPDPVLVEARQEAVWEAQSARRALDYWKSLRTR